MMDHEGSQVNSAVYDANAKNGPTHFAGARDVVSKHAKHEVTVVIPAHNEADAIGSTLDSIADQTRPADHVLVIADNCTDATVNVAYGRGADAMRTVDNVDKKAGALNQGLRTIMRDLDDDDLILIMDADSRLAPDFIAAAIAELEANPTAGAICARFGGEPSRRGLIHLLQRNEYDRFTRSIDRRDSRAYVVSGVATIAKVATFREILQARWDGHLPDAPGVYDVTATTEDIELTYAFIKLGYTPLAPRGCVVYTDTMDTWTALTHQRIRWQRGMLDALRTYRVTRQTMPFLTKVTGMYLLSLATVVYFAVVIAAYVHGGVHYQLPWLLLLPFFSFERAWTVRRSGPRAILLAAALLPEWGYDNFRAAAYWWALIRWVRRTERVWIPT